MKPKAGKAKSKRRTLKDKYKIERKVREHHRKQRKEERLKGKGGLKKDPGIPNLHPFKEAILAKVTAAKERVEEDKQRRKDARKESHAARRQALMEGATSLEQLQADADARAGVYEAMEEQVAAAGGGGAAANGVNETSRRSFFKEFRKVRLPARRNYERDDKRPWPFPRRPAAHERCAAAPSPSHATVHTANAAGGGRGRRDPGGA